ncbi:MAG: hypothetical protein FWD05_10930 [Oscillospiraceae bacterium]|nr:hypothetical protein [Oscillospiraceae bacterium]
MFMVKDEYINTKKLIHARFLAQKLHLKWVYLVYTLIAIGTIGSTVVWMLTSGQGLHHRISSDLSVTVFLGIFIGYVVIMFVYKSDNNKFAVYPQTNNSRFLSSLISNHLGIIFVATFLLVLYFMHFGTARLMSVFIDDIHFALNFSLGFVIAGFFVYLSYSFLLLALITLFGAIVRKWKHYAVLAFAVILSIMIGNLNTVIEIIPDALAFIIREPSLLMFFLKAAGLWTILTVLAIVINNYTVYYKSYSRIMLKWVVATCVGIVIIVPVLFGLLYNTPPATTYDTWAWEDDHFNNLSTEEIHIDLSHLPIGSSLNISVSENIKIIPSDLNMWFTTREIAAFLNGAESLHNIQGDTLVIFFNHPFLIVNGINLFDFSDTHMTAHLEGDTLFINYYVENAYVITIPTWSFARQFSLFQDRGLFREHIMGSSVSGNMFVDISLLVE